MVSAGLCCVALCCDVLCHSDLCCAVLCCAVLCCAVLCGEAPLNSCHTGEQLRGGGWLGFGAYDRLGSEGWECEQLCGQDSIQVTFLQQSQVVDQPMWCQQTNITCISCMCAVTCHDLLLLFTF